MSLLRFNRASQTTEACHPDQPRSASSKREDRDFALLLTQAQLDETSARRAWKALGNEMALVPEGEALLVGTDVESLIQIASHSALQPYWIESFYMDRCCVTNAEFAEFVAEGGYADETLWPEEILANLLQFVDASDVPGPANWQDGRPPSRLADHPVTGICWYEANAYAHWRGKRLPSPAEWQWAAVWSGAQNGSQRRFPWGDAFDAARCNTWNSGMGRTVAVDEFYSGTTPNGIYQMIGNVWEWTSALFEFDDNPNGDRVLTEFPMAEVRGGAFDTYFASQATAQFRTGQSLLFRANNIGFRCCLSCDQLANPSDPFAFLDDADNV